MLTIIQTIISIAVVLLFSLFVQAKGPGLSTGSAEKTAPLGYSEALHLKFMRAEEKLAHDVYLHLSEIYPDNAAFSNITKSETRHIATMAEKLAQYGLDDVNADDPPGVFSEENYGTYFEDKYTFLIEWGEEGLFEALMAGALIEELDMHDIVLCPEIIIGYETGITTENDCGRDYTDNKALVESYNNLLDGSANHLRSFVRQIETLFPEKGVYTPQYLSEDDVNAILNR